VPYATLLHIVRSLGGLQSQSGHFEEEKCLLLQLRIESQCVGHLAYSLITIETKLLCITQCGKEMLINFWPYGYSKLF